MGVTLEKIAADHPDAFDIHRQNVSVTVLQEPAGEQLLLRQDLRTLRLDIREGTLLAGPVRMHYMLGGYHHLDRRLLTLRRLSALRRLGRLPTNLYAPHPKQRRWSLILRTIDAMAAGSSQREIATVLFGTEVVERDWAAASSYLRLRVQRLAKGARALLDGGYLRLLGGSG